MKGEVVWEKTCECGYVVRREGEIPKKIICYKCKKILKEVKNDYKIKKIF